MTTSSTLPVISRGVPFLGHVLTKRRYNVNQCSYAATSPRSQQQQLTLPSCRSASCKLSHCLRLPAQPPDVITYVGYKRFAHVSCKLRCYIACNCRACPQLQGSSCSLSADSAAAGSECCLWCRFPAATGSECCLWCSSQLIPRFSPTPAACLSMLRPLRQPVWLQPCYSQEGTVMPCATHAQPRCKTAATATL